MNTILERLLIRMGVIRCRHSNKNRQCNDQKKKDKRQTIVDNTENVKPIINQGELVCSVSYTVTVWSITQKTKG